MEREGTVAVDGARLWYRVDGDGPDLVLVHAGIADLRMWDGLVAELAGRRRCIRFDMRGFGRTTYPAGAFSGADDVEAVLAALDVHGAVVVGASFGGLVTMEHAIAHPGRVERLVLLDALLPDHDFSAEMEAFWVAEEAAVEAGRLDEAVELNVRQWAGGATAEHQALVREMQARAFELQLAEEPEPVEADPSVAERLHELAMPVAVAYGERDVADFIAIAQRLATELPDATLHAIAGAGHLPALEQPAAVAKLLLE
jgi:pimeloyl-ACP methyl ester carboxylesterase